MSYSSSFCSIVREIDKIMHSFLHQKKDIGYGYRRTLTNGMRFDVIDYKKTGIHILRIGRGAWLVRQYPLLYGRFDEVAKVIAKVSVPNIDFFYDKGFIEIVKLLEEAPPGIRYDD